MSRKGRNLSSAVNQQRAAKVQVADAPERALHRALNYYPTPVWGGRAGAEIILELDPTAKVVREPACGEGHMAHGLKDYFEVIASDIHNFGYGAVSDFLLEDPSAPPDADWIVTNPPFDRAERFLAMGLRRARRGVALLCRIAFLEGCERYRALYQGETPMTVLAPFIERVPMQLGSWDPELSSAACYAWFFFQKGAAGNMGARVRPIPPGTKDRLHRPEDVRRFAKLSPAPLFDTVNQ